MAIEISLDWLSLTYEYGVLPPVKPPKGKFDWSVLHGMKGYDNVIKDEHSGLLLMRNEARQDMGLHLQASGDVLRTISGLLDIHTVFLPSDYFGDRGKCTRIDVAVDFTGDDFVPVQKFVDAALRDEMSTRSRKFYEAKSVGSAGHTFYVGSRTGRYYLRIYDKQAESNLAEPRTRVELEIKQDAAKNLYRLLCKSVETRSIVGAMYGAIAEFINFPMINQWDGIKRLAVPSNLHDEYEGETDTWRWLMRSVAPTFLKAFAVDGDWALLERFVRQTRGDR